MQHGRDPHRLAANHREQPSPEVGVLPQALEGCPALVLEVHVRREARIADEQDSARPEAAHDDDRLIVPPVGHHLRVRLVGSHGPGGVESHVHSLALRLQVRRLEMSQGLGFERAALRRPHAQSERIQQWPARRPLLVSGRQDERAAIVHEGFHRLDLGRREGAGRCDGDEQPGTFEPFGRELGQIECQVAVSHERQRKSSDPLRPPGFAAVRLDVRCVDIGQVVGPAAAAVGQQVALGLIRDAARDERDSQAEATKEIFHGPGRRLTRAMRPAPASRAMTCRHAACVFTAPLAR